MAWDSKSARRRQNSSASGSSRNLPLHIRQQSRQASQPKSAHVADPFLHDFLSPSFSAADYLNAMLPPLQVAGGSSLPAGVRSASQEAPVPLADLSTQAQTTLSQLNVHTTRLTNTLTQLTDEILRSGSRLAYEVELLRGETLSLAETLTDGLHDDIVNFVPGGIRPTSGTDIPETNRRRSILAPVEVATEESRTGGGGIAAPDEPPYIIQLRTLTLVRSRLDSVIKTFGDAMEFVFPPSELSVSSSFLSVSAPDPGLEAHSTEEKGQQVLQNLRDEISGALSDSTDPVRGVEDAARRIEELRELNAVWRGTAEERGRAKFIDSLAKMVEDKHRDLVRELGQSSSSAGARREVGERQEAGQARTLGAVDQPVDNRGYTSGYGLMSQLQRIRGGL